VVEEAPIDANAECYSPYELADLLADEGRVRGGESREAFVGQHGDSRPRAVATTAAASVWPRVCLLLF
jgi:hypothetical protein